VKVRKVRRGKCSGCGKPRAVAVQFYSGECEDIRKAGFHCAACAKNDARKIKAWRKRREREGWGVR
jgi:hypothetical protein